MKFLHVYCVSRGTSVYINIEKVVLLTKVEIDGKDACLIEVEGLNDGKGPIEVHTPAEQIMRMINGEDKVRIGFRTGS
jgi:hypothetical protein